MEPGRLRPHPGQPGFRQGVVRLVDNGDRFDQKLLREVVFYKDLATGEILETFLNPYTSEEVRVVPVTNDPFNLVIEKYYPNTVVLETDIHLFYPSALQPDKWPRESAGKNVRVSEMLRYVIRREDLENPAKTSVGVLPQHRSGTPGRRRPLPRRRNACPPFRPRAGTGHWRVRWWPPAAAGRAARGRRPAARSPAPYQGLAPTTRGAARR